MAVQVRILERARGAADLKLSKVGPITLTLFAGQGIAAHKCLVRRHAAYGGDEAAQLPNGAGIAARFDHLVQTRRAQFGILYERLDDESLEAVQSRGRCRARLSLIE